MLRKCGPTKYDLPNDRLPTRRIANTTSGLDGIRCGCCLRNPLIRNQTLAAPDFLRDTRSGPRFLKFLPANNHEKCRKTKKCHEIGPGGSDFDENLCGRRYFSWRIFLGGSRPDLAKSTFWKNKKFSGETRAPPGFLKLARLFKKFR